MLLELLPTDAIGGFILGRPLVIIQCVGPSYRSGRLSLKEFRVVRQASGRPVSPVAGEEDDDPAFWIGSYVVTVNKAHTAGNPSFGGHLGGR